MRNALILVATGLLLMACSSSADTGTGGGTTGSGGGGGAAADDNPNHGAPPANDQDGPGNMPAGAGHNPPSDFDGATGPKVTVSGTVTGEGELAGTLYVDFVVLGSEDPPTFRTVHSIQLEEFGAFSVQVPRGFGAVTPQAFVDLNDNGLSVGEPSGQAEPLEIGTTDVTGLTIEVKIPPPPDTQVLPEDPLAGGSPPEGIVPPGETAPPPVGPAPAEGEPPPTN
ncbi:MAG: hypothetical protein QGH45_05970 [Myxococcota bacterium]|nr:hypothetical protein [Myxococcota bacterium]